MQMIMRQENMKMNLVKLTLEFEVIGRTKTGTDNLNFEVVKCWNMFADEKWVGNCTS